MRPKPPTVALYVSGHGFGHDPDTTSPPQADFPLSAQKAGQPQGRPYIKSEAFKDKGGGGGRIRTDA